MKLHAQENLDPASHLDSASQAVRTSSAEVYRLANGSIVYIEKDINVAGWARITRLANLTPACSCRWTRWTYASEADAQSALADWDPDTAAAPAGWVTCGQAKTAGH